AVAAGATHVVSINVDVDAHTCLIMIDGTSFSHAWTAGISEFALVEFAMSTNDPNRGDAHVDSILIVDSGRVLASWASPVSGDWIDGVNWSGAAALVSGDAAFIRQPSAGAYTVQGPASALSLYVLAMANTGGGPAELRLNQNISVTGLNSNP